MLIPGYGQQGLLDPIGQALGLYQSPQDYLAQQHASYAAQVNPWRYPPYVGMPVYKKEGTLEITVKFEKVDGHHILITAGCEKRVVHNRKELLKAVQELAAEHTEALVKELK